MQPDQKIQTEFQKALSLQQEKKYNEALSIYTSILQQNTDLSPAVLSDVSYNAALASFQTKDLVRSYVYNQKSLLLNPRNSHSKDLAEKLKAEYQVKNIPHDISLLENLNKAGFANIPVEAFWLGAIIFLVLFLKGFSNFYLQRKKEVIENLKFSNYGVKNYLWLILFLTLSSFAGLKIWDEQTPKALVKVDQITLKTAAGENQASLTDLPGGSLVHILRSSQINNISYFQIKYPGGVSGWVKKEELEFIFLPKD